MKKHKLQNYSADHSADHSASQNVGQSLNAIKLGIAPWYVQLTAIVLYAQYLLAAEHTTIAQGQEYELGAITLALVINFVIKLAISMAVSMAVAAATAKKPPKTRFESPVGIEGFDLPTAEEGRPMQVLFGKKYITGPNIVWYGHLKTTPVIIRA